jgi:hypothetical protein
MNPLSIAGAFIITIALLFYGVAFIAMQRFKLLTSPVLVFMTLGILFDLTAISFMIVGSDKGIFTPHGILGYSATLTMIIDVYLVWKTYLKNGLDAVFNKSVLLYSKIAYIWWLIAYITGSMLVLWQ